MFKQIAMSLILSLSAAASTRYIDGDAIRSSDRNSTWTPPGTSDVLLGQSASQTLTNKTIDGNLNTLRNITVTPGAITLSGNNSVVFTDTGGKLTPGYFTGNVALNGSTVTIQPGVVTNAMHATMNNSTIKCNVSGGAASPADCSMGQVGAAVNSVLGALLGANNLSDLSNPATARTNLAVVPNNLTSGSIFVGSAGNLVSSVVMSGHIAINSAGTTTIQAGVVTNAMHATMNNSTIKCNISGGAASPSDCTGDQIGTVVGALIGSKNLSDIANTTTARTNLGLGTAAILAASTVPGAQIVSNGSSWIGSTVAVPGCSAIGGTQIDWSLGNCFTKTLSANTKFSFANAIGGQQITVRTSIPGTAFTLTWPNNAIQGGSVLWTSSTVPAAGGINKTDLWTIFFDGTNFYANPTQSY